MTLEQRKHQRRWDFIDSLAMTQINKPFFYYVDYTEVTVIRMQGDKIKVIFEDDQTSSIIFHKDVANQKVIDNQSRKILRTLWNELNPRYE